MSGFSLGTCLCGWDWLQQPLQGLSRFRKQMEIFFFFYIKCNKFHFKVNLSHFTLYLFVRKGNPMLLSSPDSHTYVRTWRWFLMTFLCQEPDLKDMFTHGSKGNLMAKDSLNRNRGTGDVVISGDGVRSRICCRSRDFIGLFVGLYLNINEYISFLFPSTCLLKM